MPLKGRQNSDAAARGKYAAVRFKENPEQNLQFSSCPPTPNVCLELQENQNHGSRGKPGNIWVYSLPLCQEKLKREFISCNENQSNPLCLFAVFSFKLQVSPSLMPGLARSGEKEGRGQSQAKSSSV